MTDPNTTLLDKRAEAAVLKLAEKVALKGGGGDNGDMSAWQQSIEARLGRIEDDLRALLYGILGSFVLSGGMIITAYLLINGSMRDINTSVQALNVSVEVMKTKLH